MCAKNGNVVFQYLIISTFLHLCFGSGKNGQLLEYCHTEIFNPTCKSDEVILMQVAHFGQMRLGHCVDEDYGYLGCSADVLKQMDNKCSGLQSCYIHVSSMNAELNCTIPKTLARYLEAQYICQKATEIEENCQAVGHGKHNIPSQTLQMTECGTETKPYIITAKQGQKINISIIDFNWNPLHENIHGCVQRYGYVIDVNNNEITDICGKSKRAKNVVTSAGSLIQIVVDSKVTSEERFILKYEVIGCPTFETPKDTIMEEAGGLVTVKCSHNDKMWKMRCIGNHWIGIKGNCTKVKTEVEVDVHFQKENYVFGMPPVIGFSLIGGIFLVIICVMVTTIIGFFCIRKPKPQMKEYYMSTMPFAQNTFPHSMINATMKPDGPNQTLLSTNLHGASLRHQHRFNQPMDQMTNDQTPQYFILENGENNICVEEPVYDAVYQNINDANSI